MPAGIIISESEPVKENRYAWFKPRERQWYKLNDAGSEWELTYDEPEFATSDHTHEHLDDLADIVTLLGNGVTGSKTIGNYTLTFNHGVLVGFEQS